MSEIEQKTTLGSEPKIKGALRKSAVKISKKEDADALSSRGYGTSKDKEFLLSLYEALYLVDKGMLEVEAKKGKNIGFRDLLECYESVEENAWVRFLIYRDLRSRGYVVREGFGLGVDFRLYDRGEYSKGTAKYLVLNIQEGKPISMENLIGAVKQSQNLEKELILAVMNRRGEIVYYSVSQLTFR